MKTYKQLKEDIGLSTGAGIANPDVPMSAIKRLIFPPANGNEPRRSKFAGFDVFDVDSDTFHKCRLGKLKFKHWKSYVGEDSQGLEIRGFANKNFKKPIVLRHEHTGAMMFVRGSHLNFITGN